MSILKLIKDQADLFAAMDKRFAEGVTPKDFQERIASITEDREKQIIARIKALESQKAVDLDRYDAAIETEKKALEDLKSRRIDPNPKPNPKPGPKPVNPARPAPSGPPSGKQDAGRTAPAKKGPKRPK